MQARHGLQEFLAAEIIRWREAFRQIGQMAAGGIEAVLGVKNLYDAPFDLTKIQQ